MSSSLSILGNDASFPSHAVASDKDGAAEGCEDGCEEGGWEGFGVGRIVRFTSRGNGEEVVGSCVGKVSGC